MFNLTTYLKVFLVLGTFLGCPTFTVLAQNKKIDSLIVLLNKTKVDTAKIPILRQLSIAYTSVDVDKKFMYANQYRLIAEKHHIDSLIPMAYLDMGIKYGVKTDYDSAMYYFAKALKIAKEKKIPTQAARAYINIGYVFDRLDNTKASIENYKLALEIFKKLKHRKGLNQTYVNLGALYYDITEYKIADVYFRQALKIAEQSKDQNGIAQGYYNIGGTSFKLGDNKKAYVYYTKSLKMREKMSDLNGIALAQWGLGELYSEEGKYDEALKALDIALNNNRKVQNKFQESAVLITLGRNYLKQKNYSKAEECAKEALANAKLMTSKPAQILSLNLLVDIAKATKNYKEAFDYQSQSIVASDSLNVEKSKNELIFSDFQRIRKENTTLENTNEIISTKNLSYKRAIIIITILFIIALMLLILYLRKTKQKSKINLALQKREAEITIINQELEYLNEELKAQNDLTNFQKLELERINTVKNKFFSIVSHDLRSPIATLQMLFKTYYNGDLTQQRMDELLKELEESIFETADFLDNLLEWSKSQLEGMVVHPEPVEINLLIKRNLQMLTPQIVEKKLEVRNYIDEKSVAFVDKNMLNVIVRNILSNSVKFCKTGDSILIKSAEKEKKVILTIQDTGIGMHPEIQKKIFRLEHSISQGTSEEKGHRIGLVLVKDMVELNNGRIWFESTFGEGTTFFVELPLIKE